jgi:3-oxoadipate CoA-transferase beta subunit
MDSRGQRHAGDIGQNGGVGAMSYAKLTRDEIAKRIALDIPEGSYVNLGIGMPTLVGNHLPKDREIFLHSENGILGMGPAPAKGEEDGDLINAGKEPVTLLTGGAFFHHTDSFAMMRGGHLDIAVLGAFQVSVSGDLANWHTGGDAIPAVGGAMDLAVGAKNVWVMMEHLTKEGASKLVERCTYPLTGIGVVKRVYTDLAVIEVTTRGLIASRLVTGLSFEELQRLTGVPLSLSGARAAA